MKLIFRKAKKKDENAIAKLLAEAYVSLESDSRDALKVMRSEVRRGYHYVVAESDNKIIGLSAWFYHGLPKHCLIEIDRFAVLKRYQRRSIGTQIFKYLTEDANRYFRKFGGLRKIFLFTRKENIKAQKFYESLHFKKEGKVKKHFYENKDDLIYSYYISKRT